jgi:SMI1 / KNR4 family (SUKH-1)
MHIEELLSKAGNDYNEFKLIKNTGLNIEYIQAFENSFGYALPDDIIEFYTITNGLQNIDDSFSIIPLRFVRLEKSRKKNYFEFAEYLFFCDTCYLEVNVTNRNEYKFFIYCNSKWGIFPRIKYVANSINELLSLYLKDGVDGIWRY